MVAALFDVVVPLFFVVVKKMSVLLPVLTTACKRASAAAQTLAKDETNFVTQYLVKFL